MSSDDINQNAGNQSTSSIDIVGLSSSGSVSTPILLGANSKKHNLGMKIQDEQTNTTSPESVNISKTSSSTSPSPNPISPPSKFSLPTKIVTDDFDEDYGALFTPSNSSQQVYTPVALSTDVSEDNMVRPSPLDDGRSLSSTSSSSSAADAFELSDDYDENSVAGRPAGALNVIKSSHERLTHHESSATHSSIEGSSPLLSEEYRIFVKAVLQLLDERDANNLEVGSVIPADFLGSAGDNDAPIIKAGPLKKASHLFRAGWKVKYVEIQKGMFTYYDDSISADGDVQSKKSIPLYASCCTCRPVRVQNKGLDLLPGSGGNGHKGGLAMFELAFTGGPRRLWMVNSREEREAWIRAIHEAMIGASVTRGDNFFEYDEAKNTKTGIPANSLHKSDMQDFLDVQNAFKSASSKEDYLNALSHHWGVATCVPVEWVRNRFLKSTRNGTDHRRDSSAFYEEIISSSVVQLWKDLQRDNVSINGELYSGGNVDGPERIIGALTRTMMEFDKSSPTFRSKSQLTEIQAIAFARDILLACNRTRSAGDMYYCMETLCARLDLVVLCPVSVEATPLCIEISHVSKNDSEKSFGLSEKSVWASTRSGVSKPWRDCFCILSEGVLSYYAEQYPKPHGLKGQFVLVGAGIGRNKYQKQRSDPSKQYTIDEPSVDLGEDEQNTSMEKYVLYLFSNDRSGELHLGFQNEEEMLSWDRSLRKAIKRCTENNHGQDPERNQRELRIKEKFVDGIRATAEKLKLHRGHRHRLTDEIRRGNTGAMKNKTSHRKTLSLPASSMIFRHNSAEGSADSLPTDIKPLSANMRRAHTSSLNVDVLGDAADLSSKDLEDDSEVLQQQPKVGLKKISSVTIRRRPTLRVNVSATMRYKICTADPEGNDDDNWAEIQMKFMQHFILRGGSHGKIVRGEALVNIEFCKANSPL
mmetsp:Transcript_6439/g.9393  ORF Transcript_6439/g.9393 Transcript_6439/m.9393 type:complete len:926 (+) Transcript_6439:267-3044(+)|eukprot:CAMPEP_0196813906 /NCGR_PEP_ID=MMETSP1362-20130617/40021_1 /TAXON_ID=163516 /ORGANISM="Leptocylindrus danicus, Strain CCMP1856" /LENGTH=925 /DNA_ID=CAMNT_0042190335 /DNA_START=246 /DNA_END=3023 /DNA_ORIENTATION=+